MTLAYLRFTAVLLIYDSLFLSDVYYYLSVFWCAVARISELELQQQKNIKFLPYSPNLALNDFFSVTEDKGNIERKAFWWHWRH
jgi:hypothetical protein